MRRNTSGIRPKLALYAVFRCQISAGMFARSAIANTSSSDSKMRALSERWCVKYTPPDRAATFASSTISSVDAKRSGTY